MDYGYKSSSNLLSPSPDFIPPAGGGRRRSGTGGGGSSSPSSSSSSSSSSSASPQKRVLSRSSSLQRYTRVSTLGRGSFGTVEKVRNRDDGGMYALKTIVYQVGDRKERLQALEEARLLRNLSHPCVVRFQEAFETADRESMCIVMELCFGTLVQASKHAIKQNSHFTERRVLSWLFQMSMALDFLHEQNMLHRDIKPANVFLSSHGHAVKLGDFGLVRALEGTLDMANTRCGTPLYNCSPEICESRPYNSATDMWGLGVVVYELLQLRLPFTGKRGGKMNMIQLLNSVVKDDPDPLPSRYSRGLTRLVERHLLCKDQRRRPSAWQLLQLPFVVQHMNMFLAKPHPSVSDALLGGIRECLSRIEREILDEEGEGGEEDLEEDDVEVTWHPDDFADDFGSASGSASGRRAGGRRRTSASPRGGGGGMVRGGGGGAAAAAARVDSHLGSPMDFRAGEPMTASPDFVPASGNRRSDYSSGSRKRRSVLDELDDECGYDDDDEEEDAMGNTLRQLSQEFEDIMR